MNIAYFLLPKSRTAFLYDDYTVRQGLEKMRYHGYAAIPVISRSGKYVGTVSEGDFLWNLIREEGGREGTRSLKELEKFRVRDILCEDSTPPVGITVSMEELVTSAMHQNFVPVVDDLENFIGIITRKDIIRYFAEEKNPAAAAQRMRKIV